jgi:uncharacterized YigZ family protein
MIDEYITIINPVEAEIKVKASRFIGIIHPADSVEQAQSVLESVSKRYYDATHHCYAYQTGVGGDIRFRYTDDGEPSGTAGKPIYQVITGNQLTNVIIIVTRYFGGTKLGTGGLVRAYSDCASEVTAKAERVIRIITAPVTIAFPYAETNTVMRVIHSYQGNITHSEYDQLTQLTVDLRLSVIETFKSDLINLTRGQAVVRNQNP